MNPGTPVSTTVLNLTRDLIPSLISPMASSGMAETSKFSLIRLGVFEVVRGRPALDSPGEQDLRRGLADSLGDSGDDRIFQQPGLATMPQRRERLQHDAILPAIVEQVPFREIPRCRRCPYA